MRDDLDKKNLNILIDADILQRLAFLVREQMGLDFTGDNRADLARGLRYAAAEFDFKGEDAGQKCAAWLVTASLSAAQIETLAHHLTIGETYFFRDPALFEGLRLHIWPALLQARRATGARELRIWSAACCTGEEPYSLAMQLHALLPQILPDWKLWKITILATDLNPAFLKKAENAIYSAWSFRSASQQQQKLYFDEIAAGRFQLKPEIRRYVKFAPLNLVADNFPSLLNGTAQQDIIFCRNVLMYFSPEKARLAASKLIRCLNEGAYLVPAASEASASLFAPLVSASLPEVILYKKVSAAPKIEMRRPLSAIAPAAIASTASEMPVAKAPNLRRAEPIVDQATAQISPSEKRSGAQKDWHEKARLAAGLGRLDEALRFCDRAIEENKMAAPYYYLRASILLEKISSADKNESSAEQENTLEAEAALRRALYLEPDFALAHFVLGNLERRRGRAVAARRSWQNALRLLENLPPEAPVEGGEDLNVGHAASMIERALANLNES